MRVTPAGSGPARNWECVHRLFEHQARLAPSRTAVVLRNTRVSYGELNRRADQLACLLRRRGIGPEICTGLVAEPSVELLIGILGILKAGGAYVPLDPHAPPERQAFISSDAKCPLLLTQSHLLPALPLQLRRQAISLDQPPGPRGPDANSQPRPDNLAYVMYTSGTTGRPKGVSVEHRQLVYSTQARGEYYRGPLERFLLLSPAYFDSSVAGLFWTLCQAGTLVLFDHQQDELTKIPHLIEQHQITHLLCIPSLWRFILAHATRQQLRSLQVVIVAGEPCPADLWDEHAKVAPQAALYNEYGPTEATVWSTVYRVDGPTDCATAPIGQPIPGTQLRVIDESGHPVAAGGDGELYIAGPGVARGYLHRPHLTDQRFVTGLPGLPPQQRCYRTGDLVRRLPGGDLEFLGRVDRQLKIRGVRIELLEIESVLNAHRGVRESAVIADPALATGVKLIAYYVAASSGGPDGRTLRAHLAERLPSYLLPAQLIAVDDLPRTANGKVNYRDLEASATTAASTGPRGLSVPRPGGQQHDPPAPVDPLESELLSIWTDLFGGRPLTTQDDFFELGGDSLAVADLISRIQRRLGLTLPADRVMEVKTIQRLARALRPPGQGRESMLIPLKTGGSKRPFFCVHPAGGHVLCYRELAEALSPAQPFYGIQCPALSETAAPIQKSLPQTASDYLAAIREVQPTGPYALGGWSFGGMVAYEMATQLYQQGERVQPLLIIDAAMMYNFALFRALFSERDTMLLNLFAMTDDELYETFCRHSDVVLLPPHADQSLKQRVFQVFASNVRALVDYRPAPYAGSLMLFCASENLVNPKKYNPAKEWRDVCSSVNVVQVAGNHFELMRQPCVGELARRLERHLDQTVEPASAAD